MGTIVYQSLIHLLLDENDLSIEEMVEIAHNRYGFDKIKTKSEVELIFQFCPNAARLLGDGKYTVIRGFPGEVRDLLDFLPRAPSSYFEQRPLMRNFYEELEARYGKP